MSEEEHKLSISEADTEKKKRWIMRKSVVASLVLIILAGLLYTGFLIYNNLSLYSDADFANRVDKAITDSENWIKEHRADILRWRNAALLRMLRECNDIKATPLFEDIVQSFVSAPQWHHSRCWVREVDPNWPIIEYELKITFEKESIDNKWILYAIAPELINTTPEEMEMFAPDKWQGRQLTHQLYALTILRDSKGANKELDKLIEHLCRRLSCELIFDAALVDIYIQKVVFILRAGFPEEIRRRWVERILDNQRTDGGWNDRWFCLQSARRPLFGSEPESDQHATIQAALALYLVRYQYPEHFGIE